MSKPTIHFSGRGPSGNIYAILGAVRSALQKQRRIIDYNNLWEAVQNCNSYEEALAEIRKVVDLIDDDGIF